MSFNPYQPPTSAYDSSYAQTNAGPIVSDRIVAGLRKTRPWVMFLSVLGFIGTGLLLLTSLSLLLVSDADETATTGIGVFYVALCAVYLVTSIALYRFASAITRMLHGGGLPELEDAIEAQAGFWQVTGILAVVCLGLTVVLIIGAIAFGAAMSGL